MLKAASWRWFLGAALSATVFLGAGCAQDVGDIDRTQTDKLDKSMFEDDDEWFFRQTVIDTDLAGNAGGGYAFTALESQLKRVRWEITEDVLYAMSTVEPVRGITEGDVAPEDLKTGVVAAFPILQHFDIQRSYSASTGEQSNVISENGSDRLWYERKYMRVDWSRNLADGIMMFGSDIGSFSAISRDVPQEEGKIDRDRTRISEDYIDTVTEYHFEPDIMACYNTFGYDGIWNCEGGPMRVRNSFKKVSDVKTYEPLEYTDNVYLEDDNGDRLMTASIYDPQIGSVEMECNNEALNFDLRVNGYAKEDNCRPATFDLFSRFGYFRTEWVDWDDRRGANVEANRLYFANRWNIWKSAYQQNEDGTYTDLKVHEREPKPIVYHLNAEFPEDMYPASQEVAREWNDAFTHAVQLAQGHETLADAKAAIAAANDGNEDMFIIARNSCSPQKIAEWHADFGNDFDEDRRDVSDLFEGFSDKVQDDIAQMPTQDMIDFCAELEWATETRKDADARFTWQRFGDLRYSFFNWVEDEAPWLGYGPSAADPKTGEIIAGNANFNGRIIRIYGSIAGDQIQYINGDLPESEFIQGDQVYDYVKNLREGMQTAQQGLTPEGKRELALRAGLTPEEASPTRFEEKPSVKEMDKFLHKFGPKRVQAEANRLAETAHLAEASDTRVVEFYEQPQVKRMLMNDPNLRYMVEAKAAATYGPEFTDADVHQAYVDFHAPQLAYDRYERRNKFFAERNILTTDALDRIVSGIATYNGVAELFKCPDGKDKADCHEEIAQFFEQKLFVGTQLHEVGHTVGLRHNFSASMDALNYHDEFWEIQKAIAEGIIEDDQRWSIQGELVDSIVPNNEADSLLPFDETHSAKYLSQAEFQLASVMDYTSDFTGRFAGLGKYDKAAINFVYAGMVEQFSEEIPLVYYYGIDLFVSDYTAIPRIMAGEEGSGAASTKDVQLAGIENLMNKREWVPVEQAKNDRIQGIKSNTANWCDRSQPGCQPELSIDNGPYFDRSVPYNFCSDEYRDSTLGCDIFDWGANHREVLNHQFNTYRLFQPYRRYRRHKIDRYYENLNGYYNWVYGTFRAIERPFRYYSIYQWYDWGDWTDTLRDSAIDALNFYAEVIATPEPGRYCKYNSSEFATFVDGSDKFSFYDLENVYIPARWSRDDGECSTYFDIARGPGQFYNYDFNDEYYYRIDRVGSYVDKTMATNMLFQISANYLYSTFFTDFRQSNITYWTLFKDEIYELIRGVALGDFHGFAGVYDRSTGSYKAPKLLDQETFGRGVEHPQASMSKVYTPMSFGHSFDTLALAMIYNSGWEDRHIDFGQYAKLAVSNDELQPFPDAQEIREFTHPVTGQIYQAPVPTDGRSITADLVDRANLLKDRFVTAETALAATEAGTDSYVSAKVEYERRSRQLEEVVAELDRIRFIWQALDASALR